MKDYVPATNKTIADVQRANDAFYGMGDSMPEERTARKQANPHKLSQSPVFTPEQRKSIAKSLREREKPSQFHQRRAIQRAAGSIDEVGDNLHAGSSRRLKGEHLREGEQGRDTIQSEQRAKQAAHNKKIEGRQQKIINARKSTHTMGGFGEKIAAQGIQRLSSLSQAQGRVPGK